MNRIIREKQDMTHLSWSKIRNSSGTAGSFLKAYSMLGGKKIYSAAERACMKLMVDGAFQGNVIFTPGQHAVLETPALLLQKGAQWLELMEDWGTVCVKELELHPIAAPTLQPRFRLTNPEASPACHQVMALLAQLCGKRVLVGQHVNGSDADLDVIEGLSGDLPALMGFDMMAFSTGCFPEKRTPPCVDEVSNCLGNIERALYWGRDRGALITLSWLGSPPTDGWEKSFYTQNTRFNLTEALEKRNQRYALLLRDIDLVSAQLTRLRDAGIPVLWRPLHEASGRWFWWGASGPETCVTLYRLMYDRMTRVHGLNNLIWVWNSTEPEWYPGDDVVDIISTDVYAPPANMGEMSPEYSRCMGASENTQLPAALGEVGGASDLTGACPQRLPWLWYMLWSGFTRKVEQNPPKQLRDTLTHPSAVLLREYRRLMEENKP